MSVLLIVCVSVSLCVCLSVVCLFLVSVEAEHVAGSFNIAAAMAREVVYVNDEGNYLTETPEDRWTRVRKWVLRNILGPVQA